MSIYAIGDLHLSGNGIKPMDIFGDQWIEHKKQIEENWVKKIQDEDAVLLPGDISWAMKFQEADVDLSWLESLPGRKFIIRGNHDFWWSSISKMSRKYNSLFFIQNNCFVYRDFIITGTRGWICPNDRSFTDKDQKIYLREIGRLQRSLMEAEARRENPSQKILVMLHYPPTNDQKEDSLFTELLERYSVDTVVYGHLHGEESFQASYRGEHKGIRYVLASSDYINFDPILIKP